jgi:multiple sugar transport system ATP-binding protein
MSSSSPDLAPQRRRVIVGMRPEHFEDTAFADPQLPQIDVDVAVVEDLGSEAHVIFPIDAPRVETEETRQAAEGEDETLLADDERALLTARVDARTSARQGKRLTLSVDPSRFHFFDPDTGLRISSASVALEDILR